jgi:isopentenyl diphosphate isomerase/L-lactate dehydrogenase-like FMN-dependent dehydrogenase
VAYEKLPRAAYDYTAHGSESEFTLRRNREAFDWVKLVPRAFGSGTIDTSVELFGTKMPFPILISPTAAQAQMHPEGEMAMHQGATAANTTMIVSNVSSFPYEKIAEAAKGPLWFQLYPREEMDTNRALLDTVQAAGAQAIVVTIDQQASYYERTLHGRNLNPAPRRSSSARSSRANPYGLIDTRLWYDWKFFKEVRSIVKVPIIAKGILTAEDARLCLEYGIDSVYVSNHGGRSLDYGSSTLEVLPEVVDAVGGKVPVLFDSGIRRGTDILKALALGATAICLGRTPRWGLGSYGVPGVQKLLEITQAELKQAMVQTGRMTLASIDRSLVRTDFP